MERRADRARSVDDAKEETRESKAWLAIRRALGRLGSRVGVLTVAEDERVVAAPLKQGTLTFPPLELSRGDGWKPSVSTKVAPVPTAGTGLRESDLLPSVRLAVDDYALAMPLISALPGTAASAEVGEIALTWPLEVIEVPESFVHLPESPLRLAVVPLLSGLKTLPLRGWAVPKPPVSFLRVPRPDNPRVKWGGDSVLRRMPVTRVSRTLGSEPAARHRLAETVHLGDEEVMLLGIYPDVPILAVERIVVEDEGRRIKLWLKPDVLRGRSGSHRITLLVGRQTVTGKMLQAAL